MPALRYAAAGLVAVAIALATMPSAAATTPAGEGAAHRCASGWSAAGGSRAVRPRDDVGFSAAQVAKQQADLRRALGRRGLTRRQVGATTPRRIAVPTYVHILSGPARGQVPQRRVLKQIQVMNTAYAGGEATGASSTPFHFRLVATDRTVNRAWYHMTPGSSAEQRAKHALHRGDATALNLYVIGRQRSGLLGWTYFPQQVRRRPLLDGVVIYGETMPHGSAAPYARGDTAVHESGHWLGLYHTFQGGCGPLNDRVADTPAEQSPNYGCPAARDTCPATGLDPVHNFMDYSTDACMNQFTAGQSDRMVLEWYAYRDRAGARFADRRF
jgi:pregnancy-associated plasma protein-A